MKKILTLFCTSLIVLLMFVGTGNSVKAAENVIYLEPNPDQETGEGSPEDGNCSCHDLIPLSGSERNVIVANLLKSEVFKNQKLELKKDGYKFTGASGIEVIQPTKGVTLVGVPFSKDGTIEMHAFFIGDMEDFLNYIKLLHSEHTDTQE